MGWSLHPGNKLQVKRKWPQGAPGRFRINIRKNLFPERVERAVQGSGRATEAGSVQKNCIWDI